jgi:hypothetical protein
MTGDHPTLCCKLWDEVLASPSIGSQMKKLGIWITQPYPSQPGLLFDFDPL